MKLSHKQVVQLCHDVGGWRGIQLVQAVQVVMGESGGNTTARNVNKNGSVDRGLWQFNDRAHPQVSTAMADDPVVSTRCARELWRKRGWQPWYGRIAYGKARAIVVAAGYDAGVDIQLAGAFCVAAMVLWHLRQHDTGHRVK